MRAAGGIRIWTGTGAVTWPANSQRRHQTLPARATPPQVGQITRSGIVTITVPPDAASDDESRSSNVPSASTAATPASTSVSMGPVRRDSRSTIGLRQVADHPFVATFQA